MTTTTFIMLTDTEGNKDRINPSHITWYTANKRGGSRVLFIDHDSANYYAETPEQIDAMLGAVDAAPTDDRAARLLAFCVEFISTQRITCPETIAQSDRVIVAAPDLLAALQAVVRVADRKTDEFDLARAAIARATTPTA